MKRELKRFGFAHAASVISVLLALFLSACGGDSTSTNADAGTTTNSASANNAAGAHSQDASLHTSKLDAQIADLEKQTEMSPGDESLRVALSQAYLQRANSLRDSRQLREALRDYQNALRHNPDNEEAQQRVAEISPQIEEGGTGENGEPAPLPITPNVTTADEDGETPKPSPAEQTPVKKKKP